MEKETAVFICVFYGFLHHSGYEKIFPLNEQRCCRCRAELTSLCEIESLVVCVFDPEKRRAIKKKGAIVYRGQYKSRDAFTFENEKHWETKPVSAH